MLPPLNLTTVFYKLKLAHVAFPAVVVVEPVTPLIAKKDTLLHQELDCPMDTLRMHTQLLCYFCLGDVDEVFFMTWGDLDISVFERSVAFGSYCWVTVTWSYLMLPFLHFMAAV
jgi:hypothetical protein